MVLKSFHQLQDLKECNISLKDLATECASLKMLLKVQSAFVKGTNCDSWEEAVSKYPDFCTAEQLKPFARLNFSSKALPDQFLRFCLQAIQACESSTCTPSACVTTDDIFCVSHSRRGACLFWKQKCLDVCHDSVKDVCI